MALEGLTITREECPGEAPGGAFYLGDTMALLGALREKYAGRAKCVYLDPPFLSGADYFMNVRVGARDWRRMVGSVRARAYSDTALPGEYYGMMREVLSAARDMLRSDGAVFVHVDYRAHARLRLIMDELFGEKNFVNEIIWAYNSGGRARRSFPRKHDIILFYKNGKTLDFNLEAVMEKRAAPPNNHMKKHVDPDGRVYRSIRSGGRTYTYYDDEPVEPTDVWDDIGHLQQKDHERTGFETQKPLKLLRRIERSVTREGELVVDMFAGACTSLEAAYLDGRGFVGVEMCPITLPVARRRLAGAKLTLELGAREQFGSCEAFLQPGVGFFHVTLDAFKPDKPVFDVAGLDVVDNWAVGYARGTTMEVMAQFSRTHRKPELARELRMPALEGVPVIRIGDIAGNDYYYLLNAPDGAR